MLQQESDRFQLPPGAHDRMLERGRRRSRNRRLSALVCGVVVAGVIAVILRLVTPTDRTEPVPANRQSVAGTYEMRLTNDDPGVALAGMAGRYELRLSASGSLELTAPRRFDLPGDPIRFDVGNGLLTTDAFVGSRCKSTAAYGVDAGIGLLTLAPVQEGCELRRIILASHPWTLMTDHTVDALEGEWTATFSCRAMVRAVRAAPVDPTKEAFWIGVTADSFGSNDLSHPCRAVNESMTRVLRFSDGRLQVFDPPSMAEGFDGRYVIDGDVVTISDPATRNIRGSYQLSFTTDGDRVAFHLLGRGATDPFFVGAWEAAPFFRTP